MEPQGPNFSRAAGRGVLRVLSAVLVAGAFAGAARTETRVLTTGWSFHRGDIPGGPVEQGDKTSWRPVSAPHDWSVDNLPAGSPPFDPATAGGADSGYLPGGVGWYRRTLSLTAAQARGAILLQFEAVYMDSEVWLNGARVATHHYGYTPFTVDLTGRARAGDNIVLVRANHPDPSSRWYAGSGLIRPVRLDLLDRLHIEPDGVAVATPAASAAAARVAVSTIVRNRRATAALTTLTTTVMDPHGRVAARASVRASIAPGAAVTLRQALRVRRPALWSLRRPSLHRLVQTVEVGGREVDRRQTTFGIRTITVDAAHGLRLNGERVVLKGGAIHHDNYMLGAAGFPRADARKLELMKAAGYNAVRSAHNPASQATLDAADRLGMLVIDEAFDSWTIPKRPYDYARFFRTDWKTDLGAMVRSGRNHPSVVMWSIGNEIPEQKTAAGPALSRRLARYVRNLDPTRPVTQAVNISGPQAARTYAQLGIGGYNYGAARYAADHARYPDRVMYGSESYSAQAFAAVTPARTMPWVIGDFVWTAVDYLGEASIGWTGYTADWKRLGPYPWHLAYSGEIDAAGRRLPASFYREVLWRTGAHPVSAFVRWPDTAGSLPDGDLITGGHRDWVMPDLHPSWTWRGREGQPLEVVVYCERPQVELFLNGRSLGRRHTGLAEGYTARFSVPYAPGTLKAVGLGGGAAAAEWTLRTAGRPAAIRLTVDRSRLRADGADLAFVTAELVDAHGLPTYAPEDDRALRFTVSGAGVLAGAGNGMPVGVESFQSGLRRTWHGRAVAVVRSGVAAGTIVLQVAADGLPTASITATATVTSRENSPSRPTAVSTEPG